MTSSSGEHPSIIAKGIRAMDVDRFDQLTRKTAGVNRRRFGHVLAALGLVWGFGARAGVDESAAKGKKKKKHKHKKRKKKGPSQSSPVTGSCGFNSKRCGTECVPLNYCCTSSECGVGAACLDGTCLCLSGFKACRGACVDQDDCCCPPGLACLPNGSCATVCTSDAQCGSTCECSDPLVSTEGPEYCRVPSDGNCDDIPLVCANTAGCPPNFACIVTFCGPTTSNRCIPLCSP
jgi:hypothetical protein